MKKSILTLVIMFAFMMTSCGQNDVAMADNSNIATNLNSVSKSASVDEFVSFTPEQKKKAKEIAKEKLQVDKVSFGSAIVYKGKTLYWNVRIKIRTYTFKSNINFSNVTYEKTRGLNAKDYAKKNKN